ncbi:MAG: TonB-dependent receptor, partial [Bacteroidota bacterium]
SNVDGYFSLVDVPSDTSTLVFSYLGYAEQFVYLSPEVNPKDLSIRLTAAGSTLSEIVVKGERQNLLRAGDEVSLLTLAPEKLRALPNLGERDVFRSFQLMPGISAANEHTSGLYVRGGTPDQALTLFDGFTVYNVDHLFGFFSTFNANAIKDVRLYKGTFDAKYGGRLSSVVEVTGKEGNGNNFNAGVDLSLLSLNGFVEAPLGENLTGIFTARRSWRSSLYNEIFDRFSGEGDDGNPLAERFGSTVSSYFYDLNAKLTWRPTTRDVISFSAYNGQDDLDNSINPQLPSFLDAADFSLSITDVTQWGNTGSSLRWSRQWNDRFYSNTLVSHSTYFSDRDRSLQNTFTDNNGESQSIQRGTFEDSDLLDYSAKTDITWKLDRRHEIGFGAFYTWNDISYVYAQNDTSSVLDRQTEGATAGIYFQDDANLLGGRLKLKPGIRASLFTPTGELYFEPRLSLNYQLTDRLNLKGSVGRYYQFAKRVIREDILEGSRDFWVLADDNRLPVSRNDQIVLGLSYETDDWLFDVEAYAKELDGLSEYSLRFSPTGGTISSDENFLVGTGTARGIDF